MLADEFGKFRVGLGDERFRAPIEAELLGSLGRGVQKLCGLGWLGQRGFVHGAICLHGFQFHRACGHELAAGAEPVALGASGGERVNA